MTSPQQRCGTCRWWKPAAFSLAGWGDCEWPITTAESVVMIDGWERLGMTESEGTTCPTWALREEQTNG